MVFAREAADVGGGLQRETGPAKRNEAPGTASQWAACRGTAKTLGRILFAQIEAPCPPTYRCRVRQTELGGAVCLNLPSRFDVSHRAADLAASYGKRPLLVGVASETGAHRRVPRGDELEGVVCEIQGRGERSRHRRSGPLPWGLAGGQCSCLRGLDCGVAGAGEGAWVGS